MVEQAALTAALTTAWGKQHHNPERLDQIHRATLVGRRHLALPLDEYAGLGGFGRRNDAWLRVAQELGEAAARQALEAAGLAPSDVGHLYFVSTTGLAAPSVDARLVNRLGLPRHVRRTPIFGLGCLGGAAGLARAVDALRANPEEVALLVAVELCSLTLQPDDLSMANVIATGLFGDGAAAVVLAGGARPPPPSAPRPQGPDAPREPRHARPRVIASRSIFYPDTERVMGWDVVDTGFKLILSGQVPEVVAANLGGDVDQFLAAHGLARGDIDRWIAHTGGPKVLEAVRSALGLEDAALARSWASLRAVGNLSSASVLFVLADELEAAEALPGELGLLAAMGPGFATELLLLRW